MFFAIARERKRRELDPVLAVLSETLPPPGNKTESKAGQRLMEMKEFLTTLDGIADRFLENEDQARTVFAFLAGQGKKKGG